MRQIQLRIFCELKFHPVSDKQRLHENSQPPNLPGIDTHTRRRSHALKPDFNRTVSWPNHKAVKCTASVCILRRMICSVRYTDVYRQRLSILILHLKLKRAPRCSVLEG